MNKYTDGTIIQARIVSVYTSMDFSWKEEGKQSQSLYEHYRYHKTLVTLNIA